LEGLLRIKVKFTGPSCLKVGKRYLTFEQLGPEVFCGHIMYFSCPELVKGDQKAQCANQNTSTTPLAQATQTDHHDSGKI